MLGDLLGMSIFLVIFAIALWTIFGMDLLKRPRRRYPRA